MLRSAFPNRFEHIVFPREEKRRRVVNLAPHGLAATQTEPVETSWQKEEIDFVGWLMAQVGLNASDYRSETLQRRLPACLRSIRAQSIPHARELLQQSPSSIKAAVSALLVGVTSFFRDPLVFGQLRQEIIRDFANAQQGVQAWSIGCSEGAELYSLAIMIAQLGILEKSYLLGTDCRADAIEQAREGCYSASAMREIPLEFRDPHFERNEKCGRLSLDLRKSIRWRVSSILNNFEPGLWDIIFFRNTALYLRPEVLQLLWPKLEGVLRPGGLLVLGRAERPNGVQRLRPIGPCIYRRHS